MLGQCFFKTVLVAWVAVVIVSLSGAPSAIAQTWDGGDVDDNNWTSGDNWIGNVAPVNDGTATIIMAGTVDPTPDVNVAQDILGLSFDNTAGAFTIVGLTLTIRGGGITNNDTQQQSFTCPIVVQATQTWRAASGVLSFGGVVTLSGFPTLTFDAAGSDVQILSPISGAGFLIKDGAGILALGGANTFSGNISITEGTLFVIANNVIPDASGVFFESGATLNLNGFSDTITSLGGNFGTVALPGNSSLMVGFNGGTTIFRGVLTGDTTATFRKISTGACNFTENDPFPFSGTYRVSGGSLTTGINERFNNAADLLVDGGVVFFQDNTETLDVVTLTSGGISGGGAGTLIGSVYNVESGDIAARLGGSAGLNKNTSGTVRLLLNNTYTGPTSINAGTLVLEGPNILADSNNVTVSAGASLNLSASWSDTIGGLSGAGNVQLLGTSALTVGGGDATSTFSGIISGTGSLGKTGTGTLTLGGANSYSSNTIINAGTLGLIANNVIPDSSGVFFETGATFDLNGFSDTIAFLGGNFGTVDLPGNSSLTVGFNGGTTIFRGVLTGDTTATFRKISFGQCNFTETAPFPFSGTYRVSGGSLNTGINERFNNAADLLIDGGQFDLGPFNETVDVVTLQSGSISGTGTLTGSAFNVESGTISPILAGNANLTKTTAGTVTLNSVNTYTGTTQMFDGTLAYGVNNVFPDAAMVIVSGGTLDLAGFSDTIGTLGGPGNVTLGTGTLTVGGNNFSSVFAGTISGSGNLAKTGSGTFSLAGSNSYSGTTTVNGGTLELFGAGERLADASDLTVSGGTFDLHEFNETVDVVTLSSGSIIGTGTLFANAFNVQNGSISAGLVGPAAVNKTTAGTVTLSGANTYSGGTLIDDGVISAGSDGHLGAAGGGLTFDGGTLRTTNSFTIGRAITLNAGGGTIDTVATTTLTGAIIGTGGLTKTGLGTLIVNTTSPQLSALTLSAGDLQLPVGGTLNVTNAVSIAAAGFMSLDGALINAGSIGNSGEIELFAGARLVGPVSNSGVIGGDGRISGALTNSSTGDIRIGSNESVHVASTAAHSNAGVVEVIAGELEVDGPLTNAASSGLIFARDAALRFDGGLTNAGSVALSFGITDLFGDITNQASADIVISGASDATFIDDVVNDGDLRVSAGSVAVFFGAVSGGGSFPGTGLVFFEGDLRPGASPAQVDFGGGVVFGAAAEAVFEIAGTTPGSGYDQLVIAGDATLDGTLTISLIDGFVPDSFDQFTLMTYASRTGSFATENLPASPDHRVTLTYGATSLVLSFLRPGDTNCSNAIDTGDIPSFVQALLDPAGYSASFPACNVFVADMNDDGKVDGLDVQPFADQLLVP